MEIFIKMNRILGLLVSDRDLEICEDRFEFRYFVIRIYVYVVNEKEHIC